MFYYIYFLYPTLFFYIFSYFYLFSGTLEFWCLVTVTFNFSVLYNNIYRKKKRFQITASANLPPGALPLDRTVGNRALQVIGVDYAGPLHCRISPTKEGKTYILLSSCSLTRAIHLLLKQFC